MICNTEMIVIHTIEIPRWEIVISEFYWYFIMCKVRFFTSDGKFLILLCTHFLIKWVVSHFNFLFFQISSPVPFFPRGLFYFILPTTYTFSYTSLISPCILLYSMFPRRDKWTLHLNMILSHIIFDIGIHKQGFSCLFSTS